MEKVRKTMAMPTFSRWSRHGWSAFASLGREVKIGVLAVSMSFGNVALAAETETPLVEDEDTTQLREIQVIAQRPMEPRGAGLETTAVGSAILKTMPLRTIEDAVNLNPSIDAREAEVSAHKPTCRSMAARPTRRQSYSTASISPMCAPDTSPIHCQ